MALTAEERITLDAFLPLLYAMGITAPTPMLKQQLVLALAEFCRDSHFWQEAVTVTAESEQLTAVPPTGARLAGLYLCFDADGEKLDPQSFSMVAPGVLSFEDADELPITVIASLLPKAESVQLPESFMRYQEAIASGTAARLYKLPGTEWFNPALVNDCRTIFREGVSMAKRERLEEYRPEPDATKLKRAKTYY